MANSSSTSSKSIHSSHCSSSASSQNVPRTCRGAICSSDHHARVEGVQANCCKLRAICTITRQAEGNLPQVDRATLREERLCKENVLTY